MPDLEQPTPALPQRSALASPAAKDAKFRYLMVLGWSTARSTKNSWMNQQLLFEPRLPNRP